MFGIVGLSSSATKRKMLLSNFCVCSKENWVFG